VLTPYARVIRRAADFCLAERLGISPRQLKLWMSGLAEPPADVFLKVADVLAETDLDGLKKTFGGGPDSESRLDDSRRRLALRPCPFCAAQALRFVEIDDNQWAVTCESCEAIGPHPQASQDEATAVHQLE